MQIAKPDHADIEAAEALMRLLNQIDGGDYPTLDSGADAPDWFDEDSYDHLRAFYDAVKVTLNRAPGWPVRVIGGMCYVILYEKNEIVDPDSNVLGLHPRLVRALDRLGAQNATEETIND